MTMSMICVLLWQLHGICLRNYAIYSLPFCFITIPVIRLYFEKNINILSLMTFFIVLEKSVPGIDADEHILNAALVDIDKRLQCHGKSLADFPGMPTPIYFNDPYDEALIIQQELYYDIHEQLSIVDRDFPSLNTEQHTIFSIIMSAVDDHKQYPKVFFIDGPGGTGKTFLYNTLRVKVRSQSKIALGLASSGYRSTTSAWWAYCPL